ncbi:MAG: DUF2062 domain-containing protein [Cytophagales bacterium]|nr:MAG: DUF2062 domain-containing protein [Cytophagales bacterium]TAF60564.1 MAG: DUF2062 domain-containing protein [Cytophagales bacterium]
MKSSKSRNCIQNILRKTRINIFRIYHAKGHPHEIALGAAIGAFWGVFPTFGLGTIFSLLLYKVFRFNLLAALCAAIISNPLTSPFFLLISYEVGVFVLAARMEFDYDKWHQNFWQVGHIMLTGSVIVSMTVAFLVYLITRYAVIYKRKSVDKQNFINPPQ